MIIFSFHRYSNLPGCLPENIPGSYIYSYRYLNSLDILYLLFCGLLSRISVSAAASECGLLSASQRIDGCLCMLYIKLLQLLRFFPRPSIWQSTLSKFPDATNWLFQESSSSPAISLFAWSPATTISGRRTTFLYPASFTFSDNLCRRLYLPAYPLQYR